MKKVVVHKERCVGCMQCMLACATAHSQNESLFLSACETPLPKPRIHVGVGLHLEGFPNRCRHCNPAYCMLACLPGAIYRNEDYDTVLIDPDKCVNCASCAMACPFGVLRFHEDCHAPPNKVVAVKCDNCISRQANGLIPACVTACKTNALTFEESDDAMKRKTDEVARTLSEKEASLQLPDGYAVLSEIKKARIRMQSE